MFHFFEALLNRSGAALPGYFARLIDTSTQAVVPIFADNAGTPIVSVSGVANMGKSDDDGNLSFYVDPGTYHLDIYNPDAATFVRRVSNVAMNSTQGDQGDPGPAGPSNNTRLSLAILKAADITDKTSLYDGSLWTWETANAPYTADDVNIVKADSTALNVGAWVRQSASGIAFKAASASAIVRTTQDKARETVSVLDYGAKGDGSHDGTANIQAALDYLNGLNGGTLLFPAGNYKVTAPITMRERVTMRGVGGHTGSRIFGTHSGNLFQCAYILDFAAFEGLAFDGAGCTAIRQTGSPTVNYIAGLRVRDCHFYAGLTECIYANLIFAKIRDNQFGYHGTAGASHRHIVSVGTVTNATNDNLIEGNRFYYAKGNESIRFDSGTSLTIRNNNFEQNTALPVRLNGVFNASITHNFFEANSSTTSEIEVNAGAVIIDSTPTIVSHNQFVPAASITNIVKVNNTLTRLFYDSNTGDLTGRTITNNPAKLVSAKGQPSLTTQMTDGSGAGLALTGGLASYERDGNKVTHTVDVTYPVTADTSAAKLAGLVFAADKLAVTAAVSDLSGGVSASIPAAATAITLLAGGALTPLTNANLSGKRVVLTITYLVAP